MDNARSGASTSEFAINMVLRLGGAGKALSRGAGAETSTKIKRQKAIDQANSINTDGSTEVPAAPDLAEAVRRQKAGGDELDALMDPKIVAKIKAGKWRTDFEERDSGDPKPFLGACRPDARARPLAGCHPEHKYECLVFKGGGAKGSIYPGAILALEQAGVMPYIKRFAGASAGALVAALLAIGLSAGQLFIELATTDLKPLVLDSSSSLSSTADLIQRWGAHPGHGLFRHIGLLFYKYTGNADITFRELYELYGVELAVAVTNISRASVEMLHVKTAPDYAIRKAVRASMSLPVALLPCRDKNIHTVISDEVVKLAKHASEAEAASNLAPPNAEASSKRRSLTPSFSRKLEGAEAAEPVEYYVDGGVLNNYPIDSFDGWWLSMAKEDQFFSRVIGEGGHKNYVERFGSYDESIGAREVNPKTIGFRLASAFEPDAMHSRLGNDALELKVRASMAAKLPDTDLAAKYAPVRHELTTEAKARLRLEKDLRASMTWIHALRTHIQKQAKDQGDPKKGTKEGAAKGAGGEAGPSTPVAAAASSSSAAAAAAAAATPGDAAAPPAQRNETVLRSYLAAVEPPKEIFSVLPCDEVGGLVELLRMHHAKRGSVFRQTGGGAAAPGGGSAAETETDGARVPTKAELQLVLEEDAHAADQIRKVYERKNLSEAGKIAAIQSIVRASMASGLPTPMGACDELTEMVEAKGSDTMKRLCGMAPKEISSLGGFINRMIEAIQMTNDERVQTKENYSRTCMLNTEYVGTMDFKLEEGDHYFLWSKGFLTAKAWLDKRTDKAKEKKKKVAKGIAKELLKHASQFKAGAAKVAAGATSYATNYATRGGASGASGASGVSGGEGEGEEGDGLKAQIGKVLSNAALRDAEKLDLIQRKLSKM